MTRIKLSAALGLLFVALAAFAQDPYYRVDSDFQKRNSKWSVGANQGDTTLIRIFLYNDGNKWQGTSDYGAMIGYGTNYENSTSMVTNWGTVNTTNNFVDFQMTAAQMNTNGIYFAQFLVTNSVTGRKYTWPNGTFNIVKSPIGGAVSKLVLVDMPQGVSNGDIAYYSTNSAQWVRFPTGSTSNEFLRFLGAGVSVPLDWQTVSDEDALTNLAWSAGNTFAWSIANRIGTGTYPTNNSFFENTAGYIAATDASWLYIIGQTSTWDSALQNIVEDTTPELGGQLDAGQFTVTNVNNLYFYDKEPLDVIHTIASTGDDDLTITTGAGGNGGTFTVYNDGTIQAAVGVGATGHIRFSWAGGYLIDFMDDKRVDWNGATNESFVIGSGSLFQADTRPLASNAVDLGSAAFPFASVHASNFNAVGSSFSLNGVNVIQTNAAGDVVVSGTSTNSDALGGTAAADYATDADVASTYIPQTRTWTINGEEGTGTSNMSWTVSSGGMDGTDLAYTNVVTLTSAAIQAAHNDGVGRISLGTGTYVFAASGLKLTNAIEVIGSGKATILDTTGQAQTAAGIGVYGSDIRIANLMIQSDSGGGTANDQISVISQVSNVVIDLCWLYDSDNDAVSIKHTSTRNVKVTRCVIRRPADDGIDDSGSDNYTFDYNDIKDTGDQGIFTNGGEPGHVGNNKLRNIGKHGVRAGSFTTVDGNEIDNTTQYGVQASAFCKIVNNDIQNAGRHGIFASSANFVVIADNTFKDGTSAWDDIHVASAVNPAVNGNTSQSGGGETESLVHFDGVTYGHLSGNNGADHDTAGAIIDSDCVSITIGPNNFEGETTPYSIGDLSSIVSLNKHLPVVYPFDAQGQMIGTNSLTYVSVCVGPYDEDVEITRMWAKTAYGTGTVRFVEAASNVTFGTSWTTNASLVGTQASATNETDWTLDAGNTAFIILDMDATSDYPTNSIYWKLYGYRQWLNTYK